MIVFACTSCQKKLSVKEGLAGKKVKCPGCAKVVAVPKPEPVSPGPRSEERTLPPKPLEAPTLAPDRESLSDAGGATDLGAKQAELTAGVPPQAGPSESFDFLAPPQQPDEIGRLGPYRILKLLGQGGMGVVFQAEDPALKRLVALKVMLPTLAASASAKQRFLREAQSAAAIEHDHIVHVYQVGEDRGVPFMAMQFLQGEPLDERLKSETTVPIAEAVRIGLQTAKGLAAAHKRGLIHRDIKPANLWLEALSEPRTQRSGVSGPDPGAGPLTPLRYVRGSDYRVKILDFGLARALSDQTHLTQQGAIIGTPAYMAPEQASGKGVDHRCDLFSLGVVLYRMCTGELPFKGDDMISIVSALALETPQAPHELRQEVPTELSELILRLLAKKPDDRPATAQAVVEELAALESELGTATTTTSPRPRSTWIKDGLKTQARATSTFSGRKRWMLIGAAAGCLVLLVLGIVFWPRGGVGVVRPDTGDPKLPALTGSPFDQLKRENIPADMLRLAGGGDPANAPKELVGVFGSNQKQDSATSLHVSPDGRRIYVATYEKMILRVWDTTTGKEIEALGRVGSSRVAVSLDGKRLVRVLDSSLLLADAITGQELLTIGKLSKRGFIAAAISPDGTRLVSSESAAKDTVLQVWNAIDGKPLFALEGHETAPTHLAFSPDGNRLATRSNQGIKIWDAKSGKELRNLLSAGGGLATYTPAFSPDSTRVATTLGVFHVASGTALVSIKTGGSLRAIAFSPDGKQLAFSRGGLVEIRDAATGKLLKNWTFQLPNSIPSLAYAPDGRHLLLGTSEGNVYVLRLGEPAKLGDE